MCFLIDPYTRLIFRQHYFPIPTVLAAEKNDDDFLWVWILPSVGSQGTPVTRLRDRGLRALKETLPSDGDETTGVWALSWVRGAFALGFRFGFCGSVFCQGRCS